MTESIEEDNMDIQRISIYSVTLPVFTYKRKKDELNHLGLGEERLLDEAKPAHTQLQEDQRWTVLSCYFLWRSVITFCTL